MPLVLPGLPLAPTSFVGCSRGSASCYPEMFPLVSTPSPFSFTPRHPAVSLPILLLRQQRSDCLKRIRVMFNFLLYRSRNLLRGFGRRTAPVSHNPLPRLPNGLPGCSPDVLLTPMGLAGPMPSLGRSTPCLSGVYLVRLSPRLGPWSAPTSAGFVVPVKWLLV